MIHTMVHKFLTLSFSGAGHLLPYHLGVATSLLSKSSTKKKLPPINAVSGSSSGAIAANLFAYFPNQIKEYTDRFISDGGRAMYHLKEMIYDDCSNSNTSSIDDNSMNNNSASLHIATTRCSDGSLQLFDFPSKLQSSIIDKDHLVNCLRASCKIPPHFHPSDVLEKSSWLSSSYAIYPQQDGIIINGESYVDGGISAPAPATPLDIKEGACRIVVSPISGPDCNESNTIRISPIDNSLKLPIDIKCRGGFSIYSSLQNLQAMQNSAGLVSSSILQDWYDRGIGDGERMIDEMMND